MNSLIGLKTLLSYHVSNCSNKLAIVYWYHQKYTMGIKTFNDVNFII